MITYEEFSKRAPKNFVGLTLTAGETKEKGFKKTRVEQELADYQRAIRAIFRKVDRRAKKENWKYKVCVCFSDEHLSGNRPSYNANGEMGQDSRDRVTYWHCHLVFYSDTYDMDTIRHVANVVRKYWLSGDRSKAGGKDKGGYNLGATWGNEAAELADLGWCYYCKYQSFAKSIKDESGALTVEEWDEIIAREWDELDDDCREYLEKRRIPTLKANHDKAENVKAKNFILQFEGLKEYGRNLTQLPNFIAPENRHKTLAQLQSEGVDLNEAVRRCFSGKILLPEYIEPYYLYNRNLHKHMKKTGIPLADEVDFRDYDKEEVLQGVRKVKHTKRELEQ